MAQQIVTLLSLMWLLFGLIHSVDGKKASKDSSGSSNIINEYAQQSNSSLLWGPYRSNLYFGVRPKGIPNSFTAGLLWYNIDDFTGLNKLRHVCDQNDDMQGYGWEQYDPRTGGIQTFHDHREQKIDLTTEFVKTEDGKSWAVRIKGKPMPGHKNALTTIVFYAGMEGVSNGALLKLADKSQYHLPQGIEGDVKMVGKSKELGSFSLDITKDGGKNSKANRYPKKPSHPAGKGLLPAAARHVALNVPDGNAWKARDIFVTFLQDSTGKIYEKYQEDNTVPPWVICAIDTHSHKMTGNLHLVQRVFRGEFEFDVIYNSKSAPEKITSDSIEKLLNTSIETFEEKFQNAFPFQAPYDEPDSEKSYGKFARELFSNLIGGVGYFQGKALVDRSYSSAYDEDSENFWEAAAQQLKEGVDNAKEEGPYELLAAVPSRPFFPRGFYWDEGFHLIPILEYDADLALEILKSWFALIDSDGWIAREQILGEEARSKVPQQFQTQFPHYANPPTLMLLLSNILNKFQEAHEESTVDKSSNPLLHSHNRKRKLKAGKKNKKNTDGIVFEDDPTVGDLLDNSETVLDKKTVTSGTAHWKSKELLKSYLKHIYPKLQLHYEWFRKTQKGDIKEWDREAFSTKEGYRWRGRTPDHCLTSGLDDYPRAATPHTGELHVDLISWIGMMTRSMKQLAEFLGEENDAEDYAEIETAIVHNIQDLHWDSTSQAYCDVTIDDFEESSFVCHKGYITLFPFLLRLIPATTDNDEKLLALLELIYDPEKLWTEYGIRSLSASDEFYGTGENYWRGPIWMNINYMILDSLAYYHDVSESESVKDLCKKIYKELRQNLVENVYEQWEKSGYAWEQYNPDDGHGQGVKHFTGWTSMTVMIMAMPKTL